MRSYAHSTCTKAASSANSSILSLLIYSWDGLAAQHSFREFRLGASSSFFASVFPPDPRSTILVVVISVKEIKPAFITSNICPSRQLINILIAVSITFILSWRGQVKNSRISRGKSVTWRVASAVKG